MTLSLLKHWFKQIFFYPRYELSHSSQSYDEYWGKKRGGKPKLSVWQRERAEWIADTITKADVERPTIADIGAGDGAPLAHIISLVSGAKGIAYDSSDVALSLATSAGVSDVRTFDLLTDLDLYRIEPSDYILFLEVLEHIPESERVLKAARQKARCGVFVSIPNSGFFTYRLRLLFGRFPAQWLHAPHEHVRYWTLADARWWLKAQDITTYTIHPYQGVPVLNTLLPSLFAAGLVIYIPHA